MPPSAKDPTPKRANKRLAQGAKSRDEILDAASRMMSSRGYEGTSVADIARESGLPNSSIYWHFNSKAGILAAVMERGAESFFAEVELADEPDTDDPVDYLRWALHRSSERFVAHPEFLRLFILLLLSNQDPEIHEIVQRVRQHGEASLRQLIERAFRPVDEGRAATIADQLTPYALALFDGAFLATQASSTVSHSDLMDRLAADLAQQGSELLHTRAQT